MYWIDQPISISNTKEIKIISENITEKKGEIPDGFKFKTLNLSYLDEIHKFLLNHYIEDDQHLVRLVYSKDFLYWYLRYIPPGFIVGLCYKNKLVGLITASFFDMIVYEKKIKVPYINLFCLQKQVRNLGLAICLIDEIKNRILKMNLNYAIFTGMKKITKPFCTSKDNMIPINHKKLIDIGFLVGKPPKLIKPENNPLHLITQPDIEPISTKLNEFMKKFVIKPYFNTESAQHFLLPKKNIVYSFSIKNSEGAITDFVSVYKNYVYCIEKNKIISIAYLGFYFYETVTLTNLIIYLIDKLNGYGIDQLVFRNLADGADINIERYPMRGELNYYFYNVDIMKTEPGNICFFPF